MSTVFGRGRSIGTNSSCLSSLLFFGYCQKAKFKIKKLSESIWRLSIARREGAPKKKQFARFLHRVSSLYSKTYNWRMIKDLYFKFGLYSQIWLNLPRDGRHFFYFFLWKLPLWLQAKIPGKKIQNYNCFLFMEFWKKKSIMNKLHYSF
jgi:hypothetical protein